MKSVNMHEAKTNLSRLVEEATKGEPFVIARNGEPLVKVEALKPSERAPGPRRTGFLKGQIRVPDDFDRMFEDEIRRMFEGSG